MSDESKPKPLEATLSEFFESKPANVAFTITGVTARPVGTGPNPTSLVMPRSSRVKLPSLRLWCDSEDCDGFRNFDPFEDNYSDDYLHIDEESNAAQHRFADFVCRNCRARKTYAFFVKYDAPEKGLIAVKLGEHPPLSLHLPSRLRKLVGSELEKFNKGLRSEAHGLGVGAFAYYRQVVENQKDRLIDEIKKVANLRKPPPKELIEELDQAKQETQFSSAVEKIKHSIPEVLLIDGHNPLILLYRALSNGLHAATDDECLQIAQDIRVILSELSGHLHTALKNEQQIKEALSRILNHPKKAEQ